MKAVLNAFHRTKKTIVAVIAVTPLVLTGTLAHADDDDDRRTKKTVVKKVKTKKVIKPKTKYVAKTTKVKKKQCYEYDDGRLERDDDCDDRYDRDDDRDDD